MSETSEVTYVMGRSLNLSHNCLEDSNNLPKTFFRECFVRPTNLSQKPPYHGVLLGSRKSHGIQVPPLEFLTGIVVYAPLQWQGTLKPYQISWFLELTVSW